MGHGMTHLSFWSSLTTICSIASPGLREISPNDAQLLLPPDRGRRLAEISGCKAYRF